MSDLKDLENSALGKYYARQNAKATNKPHRKNAKPEKDAVKEVCTWLKLNSFSFDIIEASNFDPVTGRLLKVSKATPGFSDIVATSPQGIACYIEVKAKGKRSTIRPHQEAFLKNKIQHSAFAICADSSDYLSKHFIKWLELRKKNSDYKQYLMNLFTKKSSKQLKL